MRIWFLWFLMIILACANADDAIGQLPECHEEGASIPDGWQSAPATAGDVQFALPPLFTQESDKLFFHHGGEHWIGPGFEVTLTYGVWSMSSFNPLKADRVCRTEINDVPIVLFVTSGENWHKLTAWLRTGGEMYEPTLAINFVQSDDSAIAKHILGSVHWDVE